VTAVRINTVGALADGVGQAYGLSGTHLDWANTPEQQLSQQIESRIAGLMVPVAAQKPDTLDDFFGESDALGGMAPAPQAPRSLPTSQALPARPMAPSSEDLTPMGVPTSGVNWVVLGAVGAVALILGILAVLVFW